ncbi:MAG: hypothetical protein AAFX56_10810 [Pseudomonadota bacterium]
MKSTCMLVLAVLLASGCASLSEPRLEARTYANADYENRFRDYRASCHRGGGRIYVMATGKVGRDGIPNRGDRYYCY